MPRSDLTDDLVHFIRGHRLEEAVEVLRRILSERQLRGGSGYIKGGFRCVCFSEAPVWNLGYAHHRGIHGVSYQPVGVLVKKSWLFAQGGRPVIYEPDADYWALPEEMRWRHVRLELDQGIDWTWEREWRIRAEELQIDPECARVVVPTAEIAEWLQHEHESEQDFNQQMMAQVFDEIMAMQMREEFAWEVGSLDLY